MKYQHSARLGDDRVSMVFSTLELHVKDVLWHGEQLCECRGPSKVWGTVYRDDVYTQTRTVDAPVVFVFYDGSKTDGSKNVVGLQCYTSDTYNEDAFAAAGVAPSFDSKIPVAYVMSRDSNESRNPFLIKHEMLRMLITDPLELCVATIQSVVGDSVCRNDDESDDEDDAASLASTVVESQEKPA